MGDPGVHAAVTGDELLAQLARPKPIWINHGGNQPVYARERDNPTSLEDLRKLVQTAAARGGRVKAVGSGHSFSDIVQTDDVLIYSKALVGPNQPSAVLQLQDELWKVRTPSVPRVRAACGGTIRALNKALASAGLAFANLGGYDAQTLIGAIATSTHGSGVTLPPLPDAVRSLVIVGSTGKVYQIEPTDGITDPVRFARRYSPDQIELKQDDDWFYSSIVSMGCMGVIYSITVDLVPSYVLREEVTFEPWDAVRERLKDPAYRGAHRHLEVHVNPHPTALGKRYCNVVTRDVATPGALIRPLPLVRRFVTGIAFTPFAQKLLVDGINHDPRTVPGTLDFGLRTQVTEDGPHVEQSYRIYNLGPINKAAVTAIEFAFPTEGNAFIAAVDRLIQVMGDNRKRGLYQNGPLALRFVKPSKAYLSMMYGRETCTCEIAMLNGVHGGDEMMLSYEKAMYEPGFATRLHWGQRQELTGTPGWLESAYPMAGKWLEVYRQLNSEGVFNNHFTDRMGISVHKPAPGAAS